MVRPRGILPALAGSGGLTGGIIAAPLSVPHGRGIMLGHRFWEYVRRHRREYRWGYAAAFASILMAQLSPWALKLAVDGVRRGASSGRLLAYACALILLAVLEAAFNYAMRL